MKKLFVFIMILLLIMGVSTGSVAQETSMYESKNYTFSAYSEILQNELYPTIHKTIKEHGFGEFTTQKDIETLPDEVAGIIREFNKEQKIYNTITPMVLILRLENEANVVYMLEVKMELFDSESSIKDVLNTSLLFAKRFVLMHTQKNDNAVENKKTKV